MFFSQPDQIVLVPDQTKIGNVNHVKMEILYASKLLINFFFTKSSGQVCGHQFGEHGTVCVLSRLSSLPCYHTCTNTYYSESPHL